MRSVAIVITYMFIGAVAWIQAGSLVYVGLADDKYPPEVQKIIDGILAAKYPYDRADDKNGYRALFNKVGVEGLKKLQSYSDDSIALQAAWEEVELTVPISETRTAVKPDKKKLKEFLAFMEKRCRVKGPAWWTESLLNANANANRRYNIYFDSP
ncbi:MAG TPA: hypothetical protein PLN21_17660 [Gemmatales bacterium]|nr:hypothetical protein [Gemmatales bacterium]